ncbi:MAG TPA: DUF5908 family protein [Azospirillaceae bacterium]|nr:DUF5908 family protein [Azospirillaceae bacterium]
MPLEISEIGVRLAVGDPCATGGRGESAAGIGGGTDGGPQGLTPVQMDELVDRCVRKVLRALRAQEAR